MAGLFGGSRGGGGPIGLFGRTRGLGEEEQRRLAERRSGHSRIPFARVYPWLSRAGGNR